MRRDRISMLLLVFICVSTPGPANAQRSRRRRGIPVRIESTPPGATVHLGSVDGETLGTTPLRRVRVPRGTQELHFVLDGWETLRERVQVRRWRQRIQVVLQREARLTVTAGVPAAEGATLSVDGQRVGEVPHAMVIGATRRGRGSAPPSPPDGLGAKPPNTASTCARDARDACGPSPAWDRLGLHDPGPSGESRCAEHR